MSKDEFLACYGHYIAPNPTPGSAAAAVEKGDAGNNVLRGTPQADRIYSYGGNDSLYGKGGNDLVSGHSGRDDLDGGYGHDRLYGGRSADQLDGLPGHDLLYGGEGQDITSGWGGRDRLYGGPGPGNMDAFDGEPDQVYSGSGYDTAFVTSRDKTYGCEDARTTAL